MARHWYEWLYRRVEENTPYDKLVEGIVLATSRKEGQSFEDYCKEQSAYYRDKDPEDFSKSDSMPYYWARRTIRKPEEKALNFSYTFLGVRLECAQCHKHPFDQWTQDDFNQFTAFFNGIAYGYSGNGQQQARAMMKELGVTQMGGQAQRELLNLVHEGKTIPWQEVFIARRGDRFRGRAQQQAAQGAGRVLTPKVLGGDAVSVESLEDPREPLMEWMRSKSNPYFARAFVNRVWANYFGRGIINPPDDMNLANPPSNAALLDYLATEFINHNFDMKWLHREIVSSQTYQRSWKTNETNHLDERNFSHSVVRRLPAEVMMDAVTQATASGGTIESVATDVEPRSIGPKAAQGLGPNNRGGQYVARIFGASARDTNCDCNRSNEPNLLQSIYLQNDQELLAAIERKGSWVAEYQGGGGKERVSAVQELEDRIANFERNLARAKEAKMAGLTAVLEEELRESRRQLRQARKREAESESPAASVPVQTKSDPAQVLRQAYLRTLSRLPDERESAVALRYLSDAGDQGNGLRDLLWALLNTKEFITNH
jgi:hypothetical protein